MIPIASWVHTNSNNRASLRLRLNRLLATADWRPPGMSPTAVLIVRHLSDPLPGQLAASPTAVRASLAWETAVQQQMATLHSSAARPYRGQLPPTAPDAAAVLFADEAEMLACLALDAARGLAAGRWWWQALRRARPTLPVNEAASLLQNEPRLTPAILTCLHEWGAVPVVAAVLSADQVVAVLTAVTHTFHLPQLPTFNPARSPTTGPDPLTSPVPPPWEAFLPETAVPHTLAPAHACLLGLSLSLTRRPAAVATPTFQRQLQIWWQAQIWQQASSPNSILPTADGAVLEQPTSTQPAPVDSEAVDAVKRPFPIQPSSQPTNPPRTEPPPALSQPAPPSPIAAADTVPPASPSADTISQERRPEAATPPETAVLPHDGIPTQLGGILYLINLMVQLDIPAGYEETGGLASQVGAWGTLELLARGLLAPIPNHLQADPIWNVLAELDGRFPDQPLLTDDRLPLTEIRAHLLAALRLDDLDRLAETLLLVNGRLHVTTSHVDLIMPLDAISLPVRLAGLDFDPGWQPAFGRVIQFHFG